MDSNTDVLLLNFNIRSIGDYFDTFNCFTNLLKVKFGCLSFSETFLNDNNKNLYTILFVDIMLFIMFDVVAAEVEVYLYIFQMFKNPKYFTHVSISLPIIETLVIETDKANYKLLIISIYRPPINC